MRIDGRITNNQQAVRYLLTNNLGNSGAGEDAHLQEAPSTIGAWQDIIRVDITRCSHYDEVANWSYRYERHER